MKFKLVRFNDDSYGARRLTFWGYVFLDANGEHTWRLQKNVHKYCKTTRARAEQNIFNYQDKGAPV